MEGLGKAVISRPAWAVEKVLDQPDHFSKTLLRKTKNKQKKENRAEDRVWLVE